MNVGVGAMEAVLDRRCCRIRDKKYPAVVLHLGRQRVSRKMIWRRSQDCEGESWKAWGMGRRVYVE